LPASSRNPGHAPSLRFGRWQPRTAEVHNRVHNERPTPLNPCSQPSLTCYKMNNIRIDLLPPLQDFKRMIAPTGTVVGDSKNVDHPAAGEGSWGNAGLNGECPWPTGRSEEPCSGVCHSACADESEGVGEKIWMDGLRALSETMGRPESDNICLPQ
jgi:hypothetical protein